MATADGRRDLSTSKAGEKASLWIARLDAAERQWEKGEALREMLRRIVSELEFPAYISPPMADRADASAIENAHIEQVNLNLILRFVERLRSHAGDEEPQIVVPRDKGRTQLAEAEERVLMRALSAGGAPEVLQEAVGLYCTDGNCVMWALMPFLPTLEALQVKRKQTAERMREASVLGFDIEPKLGEAAGDLAEAFMGAAFSDPTGGMLEATDGSDGITRQSPVDKIVEAAVKLAEAERKWKKAGLGWNETQGQVHYYMSPLGPMGTLIDPTATHPRNVRWIARRVLMTMDEAAAHPSFHPDVRADLTPVPLDSKRGHPEVQYVRGLSAEEVREENERVEVWEIWDRVAMARYYVSRSVDRYLNVDETYPYVDESGDPIHKPMGDHPGFFPCVYAPCMRGVRQNASALEGIPMAAPGMPQQQSIISMLSACLHAVKQASASMYLTRLDPDTLEAVKQGIPGTIIQVDEHVEKLDDALVALQWKPPPAELFREIDREFERFSMVMNFPLIELTSQPSSKTLGQDQMSMNAGDLSTSEFVRKLEMRYALLATMTRAYVQHYYTPSQVLDLAGKDGLAVMLMWRHLGTPPERIQATLAKKALQQDRVRVKQMLDLMELAITATQTGMAMGIPPDKDWWWLLEEACKALGLGEPPQLMRPQDRLAMIRAEIEARQRALANGAQAGMESGEGEPGGASEGVVPGGTEGINNRRDQGRSSARRRGENGADTGANMAQGVAQGASRV